MRSLKVVIILIFPGKLSYKFSPPPLSHQFSDETQAENIYCCGRQSVTRKHQNYSEARRDLLVL